MISFQLTINWNFNPFKGKCTQKKEVRCERNSTRGSHESETVNLAQTKIRMKQIIHFKFYFKLKCSFQPFE